MYSYLFNYSKLLIGPEDFDLSALDYAVHFFENNGDKQRYMKSRYLEGYAFFHDKQYSKAILSFIQAENAAVSLGDEYFAGLACREASRTFEATWSVDDQLQYAKLAQEHFLKGGYSKHARYTLLFIGDAYARKGDTEEAINTFTEAQHEAILYRDTTLYTHATWPLAIEYVQKGLYSDAIRLFNKLTDSLDYSLNSPSYAYLAHAYAACGDRTSYEANIKRAIDASETPYETHIAYRQNYQSALCLADSKTALSSIEKVLEYTYSEEYMSRNNSALKSMRDYLAEKEKGISLKNRLLRQQYLSLILTIILVVILSAIAIHKILADRKKLHTEKQELISRIGKLESSHSANLKRTTKSGMHYFNVLTQLYWQKQPHKVVPELESILSGLVSDDKVIEQLIASINETRNNLIGRLNEQVPSLSAKDIVVYSYIVYGFERNTICTILKKDSGAVNAQVYRIRNKISVSGAPDTEEFICAINR